MAVELLHYRPWRGEFRSPWAAIWPIARQSLSVMFRRKLFWALYALALIIFCLFFFGQYLVFWAQAMAGEQSVSVAGARVRPETLLRLFQAVFKLNGTGEMYYNFFTYQGYMVMIVLALAGSLLVGNDIRHGSMPFYLSKPISSHHYLLGKCLAVAVFINMMTTIPAVVLYVQYGVLDSYPYFETHWELLLGILAFGAVLTVVLSLMIVATAVWLRRTVPLIMTWSTLFFFFRRLSESLVDRLNYDPRWRLIDIWNNLSLVGHYLLQREDRLLGRQPDVLEAVAVLLGVCLLCLTYLVLRIRAVEVVT